MIRHTDSGDIDKRNDAEEKASCFVSKKSYCLGKWSGLLTFSFTPAISHRNLRQHMDEDIIYDLAENKKRRRRQDVRNEG